MNEPAGGTYAKRFECKFVVPESVADRVLARVRPWVEPDPHAARRPDHTYPICSLYLDAGELPLYHETVEGKRSRFKLRVRAYTDDSGVPLFLEVKRRFDRVVHKLRCPVPRTTLPAILAGDANAAPDLPPQRQRSLQEFVRLMLQTMARPRVLVRYDRQAYVGVFDSDVRVTFDRRLRAAAMVRPEVVVDHPSFAAVPSRGVVLELKFTDRCPAWMLDTVRSCELQRVSFSKYTRAVDTALTDSLAGF